jgi:hypothetical protein
LFIFVIKEYNGAEVANKSFGGNEHDSLFYDFSSIIYDT